MDRRSLVWKIPCIVLGAILGIVLLLLIAVTVVVATPSARTAVLRKGVEIANERMDLDIDLKRLYLSPFHHSPMILYHAYKGEEDLPVHIEVDSLFIGHRGLDTLLYVHELRLKGCMKGEQEPDLLSRTIVLDTLLLEQATVHSDTLIEAIVIDALVGHLQVKSPGLNVGRGQYPLHGLRLSDARVDLLLRGSSSDDEEEPEDTTSTPMSFELPDGEVRNFRLTLNPLDLGLYIGSLTTDAVADVGGNRYYARSMKLADASLTKGSLYLPFEEVLGNAEVDLNTGLIRSGRLFARSDSFGSQADVNTTLDLETLRADVAGKAVFRGSKASLDGFYDIDDERYDMKVNVEKVDASPFLGGAHHVEVAGDIHAQGQGIDFGSPSMRTNVKLNLPHCVYDDINVSGLALAASLVGKSLDANLQFAHAGVGDWDIDRLNMDFATGNSTSLHLATKGLAVDAQSPQPVFSLLDQVKPLLGVVTDSTFVKSLTSLKDLSLLDTLRRVIPPLKADILLTKGSPIQSVLDKTGYDIQQVALSMQSDSLRSDISVDALIPAAVAALQVGMTEGKTSALLTANASITDGVIPVDNLDTEASFRMELLRSGRELNGEGLLVLDSLRYNGMEFGNRTADIRISPSVQYKDAIRADVHLDDIPTELISGILKRDDIALEGFIQAQAVADGLPSNMDLSAEVLPRSLSVLYKPYDVKLTLGETPIVMVHNKVDLNDLRIYGADSTYLALNGGMDLNTRLLDVAISADGFTPVKLPQGGPIPVHGNLDTDIRGTVTGSLDDILANVDVTILPTTDLTYPIDDRNMAQVMPSGTVNVQYGTAGSGLNLGGRIDVNDGVVRYSPKLYPMMPFKVDPGSHVTFNGPLGQTMLDVSASQQVKADVQSEGEETRRVTFNTGVRVEGALDSLGLNAIGFFLEAPEDETITREIAAMDQETKEGVAAALLATGMYMGDSNEAAQKGGYALSSIINSRINAALANSKMGKIVDVDISSGETEHAAGKTSDMNIVISKSFFEERLRLTVGSVISDNPEVTKANGLLNHVSADYKLTPDGNLVLRAFSKRDYDNIFEGELMKSGVGVAFSKVWEKDRRTFKFTTDADIAYRSNSSIGPNLSLTHSTRNLFGRGETLSLKGHGAYYWSLRGRQQGDPNKTDTYKYGLDASLVFPYLQWFGDDLPSADTRYHLGYKYENIAGGYGVHNLAGALSYFIRPEGYVTHVFTPVSVSMVRAKMSDDMAKAMIENPEVLKMLVGNEFVPAIGYGLNYNDYRSCRPVNTMFDFEIKEAGNLVNSVYSAFGQKWNQRDKAIGEVPFNQFVKLTTELWNKFSFTDRVCIATRIYAGACLPLGNSESAPLSESYYTGGPNSLRAAKPYAYGPGNFHSTKYNQNYFHAGEVKLEADLEFRFPLFWKINGAVFVDAGNVWNWHNSFGSVSSEDYALMSKFLGLTEDLYDGIIDNPYFAKQIALGTGTGVRLDLDGLVIRLDLGVGIHAPYQTYRYNKDFTPDYTSPINTYFNMPSFFDAVRLNFGIGYPF